MEKRKSRNSFVDRRRKSLTMNDVFVEEEAVNKESPKLPVKDYIELLKTEKQEWKNILRKKRMECKDNERLCEKAPLKITRASVEDYLSQEDKELLENKPDYLNMVKSMQIYVDSIDYLNMYELDLIDYYKKSCNEHEYTRKMLADEMCASDLCDICNMRDCEKKEHKFELEL